MVTKKQQEVRFTFPRGGPDKPIRIKLGISQIYWVTHPQRGEYDANHKSFDKLNEGGAGFSTLCEALACIERWRKLEEDDDGK